MSMGANRAGVFGVRGRDAEEGRPHVGWGEPLRDGPLSGAVCTADSTLVFLPRLCTDASQREGKKHV